MMTLPSILDPLFKTGTAIQEFIAWKNKLDGKGKLLIIEMQNNFRYLQMVSKKETDLDKVIHEITTGQYKQLLSEGFRFSSVAKGKIKKAESLKGTSLAGWAGKDSLALLHSLYSRVEELIIKYPYTGTAEKYNWTLRVNNILRLTMLLLNHQRK
ncbi:hypothetical protein [Spirochaeta isovalerica]|uniref:Uncharacterized protein n=1 Tax=Spirochaeta isovalerica TaxID=150 RepID=A0A841RFY8_9SPIO|nr:hypothetical protein [Spirochaeta isovalerica]MBB6481262.1 hypothetical protein [Spirochaeta isovalerica]